MSASPARLSTAYRIVGSSAVALFVVLFFFKWYGASASSSLGTSVSGSLDGWHSFHSSRWVWLLTIVVALGAVAVRAGMLELRRPVPLSPIVAALGALSTLLVLYRIVHHPGGRTSGTIEGVRYSASSGIRIGIWLGLIAASGITYGGWLAMRDDGTAASAREWARRRMRA
jgi:hypothetical protein